MHLAPLHFLLMDLVFQFLYLGSIEVELGIGFAILGFVLHGTALVLGLLGAYRWQFLYALFLGIGKGVDGGSELGSVQLRALA